MYKNGARGKQLAKLDTLLVSFDSWKTEKHFGAV